MKLKVGGAYRNRKGEIKHITKQGDFGGTFRFVDEYDQTYNRSGSWSDGSTDYDLVEEVPPELLEPLVEEVPPGSSEPPELTKVTDWEVTFNEGKTWEDDVYAFGTLCRDGLYGIFIKNGNNFYWVRRDQLRRKPKKLMATYYINLFANGSTSGLFSSRELAETEARIASNSCRKPCETREIKLEWQCP